MAPELSDSLKSTTGSSTANTNEEPSTTPDNSTADTSKCHRKDETNPPDGDKTTKSCEDNNSSPHNKKCDPENKDNTISQSKKCDAENSTESGIGNSSENDTQNNTESHAESSARNFSENCTENDDERPQEETHASQDVSFSEHDVQIPYTQSYESDGPGETEELLNNENQHSQLDDFAIDEPTPPVPPDGGYGWVIAFCGFMVNLLVDGMCYMGGMLYIALLDYFQQPKGKTQWIHTLVPAVYLLTGPFVGALVNKYGCRIITIIGSLIAATFFVISALMSSVESLIFTYGIMIGIGFGCMYLPAVCFVSYYFDRKRAIATGIAVCGSGIGTFLFPPLCNFLLGLYGWRGTLMIMSGLSLNCCIFGALMRPLVATKPKPKKLKGEKKKTKKDKQAEKEIEAKRSIIMQKIIEQKKRQRCVSSGSLDGTVITKDNKLVKDPDLLQVILQAETERNKLNISTPDLRSRKARTVSELSVSCENVHSPTKSKGAPIFNKHLQNVVDAPTRRKRGISEMSGMSSQNSIHKLSEVERLKKDMARVMYRQDIFYSGSVTNIAEYKSNPDITQYTQSVVSIPIPPNGATGGAGCAPFTNIITQMFDLSLFKSVTFIVLISNAFFSFLGFFVPFMFIPDLAKIMGATGNEAAMLISILGICNTFGRIGAGWLADRPWADCLVIQNVALITGGVATAMVPLLGTYPLLGAYCCVFGVCMAMFIALRSIVTAEMMGVQKLNNAFGLTIFFQGLAGAAGSPLAGTIFDATGSYTISFIIAGSFITFSGIICLPLRRIARWENSKSKIVCDDYEVGISVDELPLPEPELGTGEKVHFEPEGTTGTSGV